MNQILIENSYLLLAILMLVPVMFIYLEKKTKSKLFDYLPPIIWIFIFPIVLSNFNIIPRQSETYSNFKSFAVPLFILFMLLEVDLKATFRIAFRGIGVLIFGAFGIVIGSFISFLIFAKTLPPDAWRGFGALAGSWIGGTGNMAAVAEMVNTPPAMLGMAVFADTFLFILYFPILFGSKKFTSGFNKFVGIKENHHEELHAKLNQMETKSNDAKFYHLLTLFGFGFLLIFVIRSFSGYLPRIGTVLTAKTWEFLILTTCALGLSFTSLRKIPGTKSTSLALVYVYMSMMGAQADISQILKAPVFIAAAVISLFCHLVMCVIGAKIFKVDLSLTATASCANIGGAASAPIVASYHNKNLVPVAIILALAGYAIGNYLGYLTAVLCHIAY